MHKPLLHWGSPMFNHEWFIISNYALSIVVTLISLVTSTVISTATSTVPCVHVTTIVTSTVAYWHQLTRVLSEEHTSIVRCCVFCGDRENPMIVLPIKSVQPCCAV